MVRRLTQIHVGFLEFLSQFYEKEAFLMDQERASMLPMIAAGESVVTGGGGRLIVSLLVYQTQVGMGQVCALGQVNVQCVLFSKNLNPSRGLNE